jgi:hypothetical protein
MELEFMLMELIKHNIQTSNSKSFKDSLKWFIKVSNKCKVNLSNIQTASNKCIKINIQLRYQMRWISITNNNLIQC